VQAQIRPRIRGPFIEELAQAELKYFGPRQCQCIGQPQTDPSSSEVSLRHVLMSEFSSKSNIVCQKGMMYMDIDD